MKNILKTLFKPVVKITTSILDMDKFWRFILTWLLCGAIFAIYLSPLYTQMKVKEKNYEELTEAVYYMSQNHTIENIPYENVDAYKVEFKSDGTIELSLEHKELETLNATLNEEYEVIHLERSNDTFANNFNFLIITIFVGLALAGIFHLIVWLIFRFISLFI